jgi:dihydropteroate synthase
MKAEADVRTSAQANSHPGKTLVMGVLNVTPDSFYGPSRVMDPGSALERARQMIADGADILDVGGESTRPGSDPVPADEELRRVVPVLEALADHGYCISIDTYRAETARRAIALGASMVNDITALRGDAEMTGVVAESGVDCVLMHMQGTPKTMQTAPKYGDIIDDITAFFEDRMAVAVKAGIAENRIWLDPGFGFGKTLGHNLEVLRRLAEFKRLGRPLLVGTSNKSTLGAILGGAAPEDRSEATAATVAIAVMNGADAVRVHDVRAMSRVVRMCDVVVGRVNHE